MEGKNWDMTMAINHVSKDTHGMLHSLLQHTPYTAIPNIKWQLVGLITLTRAAVLTHSPHNHTSLVKNGFHWTGNGLLCCVKTAIDSTKRTSVHLYLDLINLTAKSIFICKLILFNKQHTKLKSQRQTEAVQSNDFQPEVIDTTGGTWAASRWWQTNKPSLIKKIWSNKCVLPATVLICLI